jgi:hypothetical protein
MVLHAGPSDGAATTSSTPKLTAFWDEIAIPLIAPYRVSERCGSPGGRSLRPTWSFAVFRLDARKMAGE